MWPRIGTSVVATCAEYTMAGVLIHLQPPESQEKNDLFLCKKKKKKKSPNEKYLLLSLQITQNNKYD